MKDVISFIVASRRERTWNTATYLSLRNISSSTLNFINMTLKCSQCKRSKQMERLASWPQWQKQGNIGFFYKDQSLQGSAGHVCTNLPTNDLTQLKTHAKGWACEERPDERKAKTGGSAPLPSSFIALVFGKNHTSQRRYTWCILKFSFSKEIRYFCSAKLFSFQYVAQLHYHFWHILIFTYLFQARRLITHTQNEISGTGNALSSFFKCAIKSVTTVDGLFCLLTQRILL